MSARYGMAFAGRVARQCSVTLSNSHCAAQTIASKMTQSPAPTAFRKGFSNVTSVNSMTTFASKGALASRGSFLATSNMPPAFPETTMVTRFSSSSTQVSNGTNEAQAAGQSGATVAATSETSAEEPTATGQSSKSTIAKEDDEDDGPGLEDTHYLGPLSFQHKLLKAISITNTTVALGAAPYIVEFADVSMASRYGLAASLVFFGMITTGALHWVARPYVHEMRFTASTGVIEAKTTTLFGSARWDTFNLSDVQPLPWSRPVATFVAKNKFYYIDVFNFPKGELRRRLMPSEDSIPKGFKDDEDDE